MGLKELQALKLAAIAKRHPEQEPKKVTARKFNADKFRKPIAKRSEKTKVAITELKKLYPVFLSTRTECEIKSPVCTKEATVVNHNKGRGPNEILDQSTWTACCTACNSYIESHHAWAEKRGFKISRHKGWKRKK